MAKVCVVIIQTEIPHILRESNSITIVLLYDDFVDDSSKPIKNLEIFSIKNKQNLVKVPFKWKCYSSLEQPARKFKLSH